jgi:ankyrin repeat protein
LHLLSYYGHKNALEILASNLTNLDVQDRNGRTPLDLACYKGSLGCVECLLLNGASCDLVDNISKRTALHAAAYNNNEDCIRLILMLINDKKNLINAKDKFQRTPLMIAVEQGHLNTISYLVSQQADLNSTDDKKCTALHRAVKIYNALINFI